MQLDRWASRELITRTKLSSPTNSGDPGWKPLGSLPWSLSVSLTAPFGGRHFVFKVSLISRFFLSLLSWRLHLLVCLCILHSLFNIKCRSTSLPSPSIYLLYSVWLLTNLWWILKQGRVSLCCIPGCPGILLCNQGWPWTQRSRSFGHLIAGIKGVARGFKFFVFVLYCTHSHSFVENSKQINTIWQNI